MARAGKGVVTNDVIAYEKSELPVQLVYDTWTARPHFIVVQCQPRPDATSRELQATYEIIGHFLHRYPQFDQEAILSFHCGKWYQQHTSKWHAHLCVPEKPYLEKARIQITQIPQTNQWRNAKTVDEGMKNWRTKKVEEYAKYKKECVQRGIPNQTLENYLLSTFDSNSKDFQLVWTCPAPRIGIVARLPATTTLASLYAFMADVRVAAEKALSQLNANFSNFGCHLCLYVCGQTGINVTCRQSQILQENGMLGENSNIVGYIQMDESQYIEWLPHNLRRLWLNALNSVSHFVRT